MITLTIVYSTGASVPTALSGGISRPIPSSPFPITLANFGLYVPQAGAKVFLNGTVGITAGIINPTILIQVYRESQMIFSSREQTQLAIGESQTISFTAAEMNAPIGYYGYSLVISVENLLINIGATVTGPVTFTGVAYSAV